MADRPSSVKEKPKQAALELGPPPRWRFRKVDLSEIHVAQFGSPPEPELVRSVGIQGVLVPVLLYENGVAYNVADGRRRVLAAEENEIATIPALVMISGNPDLMPSVVTLECNDPASPNPIVELEAIEELMRAGGTSVSPSAIAKATGVKLKTVKARLRLSTLCHELRTAWLDGKFGTKVGTAASRCDDEQQRELVRRLEAEGTVTEQDVKDVKRIAVTSHQRTLPDDNAPKRIREHLAAARKDAYLAYGDGEVVDAIDHALGLVDGA